jgi:type II secretory pathway pseudopilin PulG
VKRNRQSGYALLVILLMVTLMAIALAAAVPAIKTQIRREQEIELQHRGNEYVKAIQKYYHKFGRYPASVEQLESTNNLRFLRRRYKDPITDKDDWKIIHLGEAKYPPKMKTNGLGGRQAGQQIGQNIGVAVGQDVGMAPQGALGAANPTAQQSPQPVGGVGYTGAAQPGSTLMGQPGTTIGGTAAAGTASGGLGQVGQSGQAMIGVLAPVNKDSIRVFNDRQKYNEWEFIYDPRIEAAQNAGAAVGGAPQAGPGNGVGGANTPFNAPTAPAPQNNYPR